MKAHVIALSIGCAILCPRLEAQVSPPVNSATAIFVEPTDDVYLDLIVGAVGWAKGSISTSLGVLQPEDAGPALRRAIEAATKRYSLKPIAMADYTLVCRTRQATRSTPASRTCSMNKAEAILQFSSVKVAGDSGFVGTGVTRVPKGTARTEIVHYCIVLSRNNGQWEVRRSETMIDPDRCPRADGDRGSPHDEIAPQPDVLR